MSSTVARRSFTVIVGVVGWFGILLQLYLSLRGAVTSGRSLAQGLTDFFGYFTILTNILVALASTLLVVSPESGVGRFFRRPGVLTAVAASIALVGLGYFFLLRQTWEPEGWQLVADVALHYVTPVLFVAYWCGFVPKGSLRWRDIRIWIAYPVAYFAYALVRGELTGTYPYPFIDTVAIGYGRVLVNAFSLLLSFVLICSVLIGVGRIASSDSIGNDGADTSLSPDRTPGAGREPDRSIPFQ